MQLTQYTDPAVHSAAVVRLAVSSDRGRAVRARRLPT